ncbi:radical SAM protein, partial [uncultured Rikenella sp.]|uniref:radical SAM protein n=1 Tax=uncultured Rikenella sp. TaxID=368003 RepID=UPI002617625C
MPEDEVLVCCSARREWLDGVVVTGGEPTLQPDLPNFLERLQTLGLRVKLDTNGTHPDVLSDLFRKKLVNFVALDVKHFVTREDYARVTPTASVADVEAIRRTLELLWEHGEVGRSCVRRWCRGCMLLTWRSGSRICSRRKGSDSNNSDRVSWSAIIYNRSFICVYPQRTAAFWKKRHQKL